MTLPHLPDRATKELALVPESLECPVWKNLELLRKKEMLSGAEMARRLSVDPMTYYRYRTQGVVPPWDRVMVAAHQFQIPPEWFYTHRPAMWIKENVRA